MQELLEQGLPPNFLFSDIEYGGMVYDMYDPNRAKMIEKDILLTPLECALDCLDEKPEMMLSIIESLLKYGANPTLRLKENTTLISQLFSPRAYGSYENAEFFFTRYQKHKDKHALEKYLAYRNKLLEQKLISNWEKTTDCVIEMLCQFGIKLDEESYLQDNTLLGLAIIHRQQNKIDLLLKYKTNPNTQNNCGETSLHLAALFAEEALIVKLLNANANPTIVDKRNLAPFDVATTLEVKKLLLKAEIEHTTIWSSKEFKLEEIKQTAMNHYKKWLTQKSLEELAQAIHLFTLVLKHKLYSKNFHDISLVADFYNLGSAYFQRCNYKKAKLFLERAYVLYLINEQPFQAKTDKYYNRLVECEKLIEQNKSEEDITSTTSDIVKPAESSSQINSIAVPPQDKLFNTNFDHKLFSAIKLNNINFVKELLKKGADPEAVSEAEGPALHYAIQQYVQAVSRTKTVIEPYLMIDFVRRDALQIIKTLLIFGADPNQRNTKGRTALHIAAIVDNELVRDEVSNLICFLLNHGADPTLRDYDNNFASDYAKKSETRHLILNALPTQSTKESISLFKEKAPQAKEPNYNDIDKKPQINTIQNITAKPLLPNNIKKNLYKTALCKFFKESKPDSCIRGHQCQFAHGAAELKM